MLAECCIIEDDLGAVEEPDYGDLLGAVAVDLKFCRPGGDASRAVLPKGRPATPWIFPVAGGYITDKYGWRIRPTTGARQFHEGLDVGKHEGADIVAPASGRVTYINQDPTKSSGRYLTLTHDDGWQTLHLHLLTPAVAQGARVQAGQRIALMGKTGQLSNGKPAVTGAHLHLIAKDPCGNVVNPLVGFRGPVPRKGGGSVNGMYDASATPWFFIAAAVAAGAYFLTKRKR